MAGLIIADQIAGAAQITRADRHAAAEPVEAGQRIQTLGHGVRDCPRGVRHQIANALMPPSPNACAICVNLIAPENGAHFSSSRFRRSDGSPDIKALPDYLQKQSADFGYGRPRQGVHHMDGL